MGPVKEVREVKEVGMGPVKEVGMGPVKEVKEVKEVGMGPVKEVKEVGMGPSKRIDRRPHGGGHGYVLTKQQEWAVVEMIPPTSPSASLLAPPVPPDSHQPRSASPPLLFNAVQELAYQR
ncbi:UNVERIFIED_CONTAM: hypothetical protein FKN15_021168 [Acipenser sinensis]